MYHLSVVSSFLLFLALSYLIKFIIYVVHIIEIYLLLTLHLSVSESLNTYMIIVEL